MEVLFLAKHYETDYRFTEWTCHMLQRIDSMCFIKKTVGLLFARVALPPLLTAVLISSCWVTLIFKERSVPEAPPVWRENSVVASVYLSLFLLFVGVFIRMALTLRRVYHIAVFSWYAFIVKCLAAKDGEELPPGIFVYGGPWKYLTFLNLVSTLAISCISNTLVHNIYVLQIWKRILENNNAVFWYFSCYRWHSLDWQRCMTYNLGKSQRVLWSNVKTFSSLSLPSLWAWWEAGF